MKIAHPSDKSISPFNFGALLGSSALRFVANWEFMREFLLSCHLARGTISWWAMLLWGTEVAENTDNLGVFRPSHTRSAAFSLLLESRRQGVQSKTQTEPSQ